jgi:hypothetical protein
MRRRILSWVSMTSSLGPRTGGVEVRLEIGICKVKKTCRLIKLISASRLMRTLKGMVSMVTVWAKGEPPDISVDSS